MFEFSDNLNQREKEILKAIIHSYLITAETVSSKILVNNFTLNISSATVRTIMAGLEKKGFITQPHTSAGRIPTNQGYRFYVSRLMSLRKLTQLEQQRIEKEYFSKKQEIDFILHQTSKALSSLTNYTGLVTLPETKRNTLKEIKIVKLDNFRILIIAIYKTGIVRDKIINLTNLITENEVNALTACMNLSLQGENAEIIKKVLNAQKNLISPNKVYALFKELNKLDILNPGREKNKNIFLEGRGNMANYPEFKNYERLSHFLKLLDEKTELKNILEHSLNDDKVNVYIGKEDHGIEECSVVTAPYKIGDEKVGVLGVIGPKRMMYSKAISAVEYLSNSVSKCLNSIFK